MAPLVSLLIPTYNSALTVADAINSCTEQTFKDIEIIVYDECSKDNTRHIINALAAKDPRIRIITSDSNSGPVRAWRKLLYEARGKYATFVWSDDLILPKYTETLAAILDANPKQVFTSCNAYTELLPETAALESRTEKVVTGVASRVLLHDFPTCKVPGDVYALGILAAVFPVSQICALFHVDAAKKVFDHYIDYENPYGFDFSRRAYGNDVSFASELALMSGEVNTTGQPLVSCRASPDSMTVNARKSHRWQYYLQYCYAIRYAWTRCRNMSPRMDALIRVVDDRVSLCDTFYSMGQKKFPREFNPLKMARAMWFLKFQDRRLNPQVGPPSLENWLANNS